MSDISLNLTALITSFLSSAIQAYKEEVRTAAKAGSYTLNGDRYLTIGGWARLPIKQRGSVTHREYVFGLFIDGADEIKDDFDIWDARAELLRDEIRSTLGSFG